MPSQVTRAQPVITGHNKAKRFSVVIIILRRNMCSAPQTHYGYVIMGAIVSQITSLTIVYSTVYSDADQRKHQSSASLAFVWGSHRGPMDSPHKWPVTRKIFRLMTTSWSVIEGNYSIPCVVLLLELRIDTPRWSVNHVMDVVFRNMTFD